METKKKVGRPAKTQNNNEVEQLKKQIEELKTLIQKQNENTQPTTTIHEEVSNDEFVEIKPNKYIKVVSLNFGRLNLTTQPKGQGKIFKFDKFGDVKNIVYSELAEIIHNHQKFAEEGRFYVLDKQVVRNHGLVEFYDKILSKDTIDNIFTYNRDQMVDLFKNATETQKENIVGILIKKVRNGENVDLNKIDALSRIFGQNIYELAKDYEVKE